MWWDPRRPSLAFAAQVAPLRAFVDLECSYLRELVLQALARRPGWEVQVAALPPPPSAGGLPAEADEEEYSPPGTCFAWVEYERTNWEKVLAGQLHTAGFCVRKGLIRKAQLAYNLKRWAAKHPESLLAAATPETLQFEFSDVDYLDEALAEVFEVRDMAADGSEWWILKPSMTNQGRGILVFNALTQLESALREEGAEDVREWVLQRYISQPLLVGGCKFHIRTYALVVGAMSVYVYCDMLTLFSLAPYDADPTNLAAHITNTCCQRPTDAAAEAAAVGLLRHLPARLHAGGSLNLRDAEQRCAGVNADCSALVGQCFEAVSAELSFMPLPNAFELYGFDFLVDSDWRVWLLEVNAQPDFAQTGTELRGVVAGVVEGALALSIDVWHPAHAAPSAPHGFTHVFSRQRAGAGGFAFH